MAASSRLSRKKAVQSHLATTKPYSKSHDISRTRTTRQGATDVRDQKAHAKIPSPKDIAPSKSLSSNLSHEQPPPPQHQPNHNTDDNITHSHPNSHPPCRENTPPARRLRRREPRAPLSVQQTGNNRNDLDRRDDRRHRRDELDCDQNLRPLKKAKVDDDDLSLPCSKSAYIPISEWSKNPDLPTYKSNLPPTHSSLHNTTRTSADNAISTTTAPKTHFKSRYITIPEREAAGEFAVQRSQRAANTRSRTLPGVEEKVDLSTKGLKRARKAVNTRSHSAQGANEETEIKQASTNVSEYSQKVTDPRLYLARAAEHEELEAKPTTTTDRPITAMGERVLRSHAGGSRSKSELAMYFPNYEQLISLNAEQRDELAAETTITLIDDLTESPLKDFPLPPSPSRTRKSHAQEREISPFGNPLANLHECEVIELPLPTSLISGQDPLSDEVYFKVHRRHERQEKQLRNIEKERAAHEKVQLERLLDELQGHDWLRVMGISGITATEKKLYEPKRDLIIKEVSALLEKFRIWKEEEKRRKLERDQAILEAQLLAAENGTLGLRESTSGTSIDAGDEVADIQNGETNEGLGLIEGDSGVQVSSSDAQSYGEPPDINDVDAWAARQLLQEARSASEPKNLRKRSVDIAQSSPPQQDAAQTPPAEEKAFTSFYSKQHLRDAAIARRRRGRFRMAFGHPVPDMEDREFSLPDDILTPEILTSIERKRRRLNRETKG